MIGVPTDLEKNIEEVLITPTPLTVYDKKYKELRECKFVLFDGQGETNVSFGCIDKTIENYRIVGIGNYKAAAVLTYDYWEKMKEVSETYIALGFCVNLDSNIMSVSLFFTFFLAFNIIFQARKAIS